MRKSDVFSNLEVLPTETGGGAVPPGSGVGVAATKTIGVLVNVANDLRQAVEDHDKRITATEKDLNNAKHQTVRNLFSYFLAGLGVTGPFVMPYTTVPQLVANTNDWVLPENVTSIRVDSSAAFNITGILAATEDGTILEITNFGGFNLTFQNQDVLSVAANRIITGTGAGIVVAPDNSIRLKYDLTTARWRVQ